MEFHCDRCGTRYSTAQAIQPGRPYLYDCRVCIHTIVIRVPDPAPRAARAGSGGSVREPGPSERVLNVAARRAPSPVRSVRPPPLPGGAGGARAALAPAPPPPRSGWLDLEDAPPSPGPRLDLSFLGRPTPGQDGPRLAEVEPTPTPAQVARPPAQKPAEKSQPHAARTVAIPKLVRSPASPVRHEPPPARPAEDPARTSREETPLAFTLTRPIPVRASPSGIAAIAEPVLRAWRKPGPLQRLVVTAAAFAAVTVATVVVGMRVASAESERPGFSSAAPVALELPPPTAPRASAPAAPAPVEPAPVEPERTAPVDVASAAVVAADAPPVAREEPAPAPRVGTRTRPPPRSAAASPAPRVATRTRPPRSAAASPARTLARPARHAARERVVASAPRSSPASSGRASPAVAAPVVPARLAAGRAAEAGQVAPPVREEEPVVARPGYRLPAPVTPACVQRHIRLPARMATRLPGSVILRFAVSRGGSPDLIQMQPGPDRLPGERIEPEIVEALNAAVRSCRFSAGTDDQGRPTRMWTVMRVQFSE